MGYLKIYCDHCGGEWQVYHRDIKSKTAMQCPHCYAQIEPYTWTQIIKGFGEMRDAETELIKDSENGNSLFTVDFIADSVCERTKHRDRTDDDFFNLFDEEGELNVF